MSEISAKDVSMVEGKKPEKLDVKMKLPKNMDNTKADSVFKEIKDALNGIKDSLEVQKIPCRNEELEGKVHPDTGVEFERKLIYYDRKIYEGVFPKIESMFDIRLPKKLYNCSDEKQFKYCVEKLAIRVEKNQKQAEENFTAKQLEQIKNREPRISGLTWHHNETPGKMQLVNAEMHANTGHTGGRSIWVKKR